MPFWLKGGLVEISEGEICAQGKEGGNMLWRVGWVRLD